MAKADFATSPERQLWVRRSGMALLPIDEVGEMVIGRLKHNVPLLTTKPRVVRDHHRLRVWWLVCGLVAEALNAGPAGGDHDSASVSDLLKIGAKHAAVTKVTPYLARIYGIDEVGYRFDPRSIGYDLLPDEASFERVLCAGLTYIETHLFPWLAESPARRKVDDAIAKFLYGLPEAAPREMERDHG